MEGTFASSYKTYNKQANTKRSESELMAFGFRDVTC
jgi:hypothetical protein